MNIKEQYLRCYFCLVGPPFLKQIPTLRWFPMEAILECLFSVVHQLDKISDKISKRKTTHNSHERSVQLFIANSSGTSAASSD